MHSDRPACAEHLQGPVEQETLLADVRTDRRAKQLPSDSGPHSRRRAVQPEIGARRKSPVPLQRVTGAPCVLLAAGHVLEVGDAAIDRDRSRDLERRLDADIRDRRKSVPGGTNKWERLLARVPSQVPAECPPFAADLARAAV